MPHERVSLEIDDYLNDKEADGALFINGEWGTGKTYFFQNEFLPKYEKRNPKPIYVFVSLNGKANIDEVKIDIFNKLHPNIAKIGKNGFVKTVRNALSNVSYKGLSVNFSAPFCMNEIVSEHVGLFIFDDFERCKIPVFQTLGFICDVSKQCGAKAILIGNEREVIDYLSPEESFRSNLIVLISNIDRSLRKEPEKPVDPLLDDNEEFKSPIQDEPYYKKIKEKTIWKTVAFDFDDSVFFESIVDSYRNAAANIARNNAPSISSLCKSRGCDNLRIYKAAMHSFSVLQGKYSKLNMSFVSDFPNFEKEMILKTFEFTINDRIPPKTKANQVLSPYSLSIGNADAMESVEQFVKFSSWNEKKFLNETRLVFEKKKDEMPKVIEDLRTPWTDESDEKVTNDYKEMINSYKNDKIPLRYLPFVYYYSWGFSKYYKFDGGEDLPKLLDDILSKIKTATSHLDVDQYSFYGSPADTEADEGLKKIYECIKIKNDELDKERLNESISDPSKLLTLQEIEKIKSKAIDDRCFISKFGADSLSERLGTSDNKEIELIRGLFKDVYGFANIKDFFEADKSDLEKFESQLKLLSENSPSKTKRKLFEWFLEDVVTYVEGL